MNKLSLLILLGCAVGTTLADHRSTRFGRRGRNRSFRRGRQEDTPQSAYGGPTVAPDYQDYAGSDDYASDDAPLGSYGAESGRDTSAVEANGDPGLAMLEKSVPGIPGEDYPIYAEVPETAFACDGQVDGGYYADPEAECQVFHICTADGAGGLAKYSFLCPNGTVFNQNYFICDWWFNFDCAEAEALYSKNDEIAAEREAIDGAASNNQATYGAPAPSDYDDASYSDYDTSAPVTEAAIEAEGGYGVPDAGAVVSEEEAPLDSYANDDQARDARRFRGGRRQGGRRRSGRRRSGRRNRNGRHRNFRG